MSSQYCNLCGKLLRDVYVTLRRPAGDSHLVMCETCAAASVLCSGCGRPFGPQHGRLSDGRPVCVLCEAEAVDKPAEALLLYEQVMEKVINTLGLRVHLRPGLLLCSRSDMQRLQHTIERPSGPDAPQGHLLGVYVKLGRRRQIAVETGLPRWMFIKVVAHEYAHAWQGENCPFLHDSQLIEGFCEWVAYKVLIALGGYETAEKMRQAESFYGSALRRVLEMESDADIPSMLQRLRSIHLETRVSPAA